MTARKPKPVETQDDLELEDDAPAPAAKPDWFKRIMFAVIVSLIWHTFTAKQGDKMPPAPEPAPVVDTLYQEVAPLFPSGTDETASLYAAYFAAQADKVEADQKAIPQKVFVTARQAMKLADNPELSVIVEQEMKPFTELPMAGQWTDKQLADLIATYRDLSDACLQSSAD